MERCYQGNGDGIEYSFVIDKNEFDGITRTETGSVG